MPDISLDQLKDLHRTLAASGETKRAAALLAIIHQAEPPQPVIPEPIEDYANAREKLYWAQDQGSPSDVQKAGAAVDKTRALLIDWLTESRPIPPQVRTFLASLDRAAFDRTACEVGGGSYCADECKELADLIRGMARRLT